MNADSSLEDVNEITKQAKVSIPAEKMADEYKTVIADLTRTSAVKGFRAGKAPAHLVEKLHGDRVRREVAGRLVAAAVQDIIRDYKLDVVGTPEIEGLLLEAGAPITFTASFSLYPSPEIKGYEEFKVQVPKREVTDGEVDDWLLNLRKSKAAVRKLEIPRPVQAGDVIDALIEVRTEGEPVSRPEPAAVGLGEGQLPAEVEQGLLGMNPGESREVKVKLDENHPNAKLRGKESVYAVTLNGLSEKVLPEADDEFAKSLGGKAQTLLELKLDLRKHLEEEQGRAAKEAAQEKILEQLLERNPFLVPQALLDDEIRSLLGRMGLFDPAKVDASRIPVESFREKFNPIAEKRVKISVMVDRIAEKETLRAVQEDLNAYAAEVARQAGLPEEDVKKYLLGDERRLGTMLEVTRTKVLDFLMKRASVEYTTAAAPAAPAEDAPAAPAEAPQDKPKGKKPG